MKNYVRDRNDFNLNNILNNLLPESFEFLTDEYFSSIFQKLSETIVTYNLQNNSNNNFIVNSQISNSISNANQSQYYSPFKPYNY